MMTLNHELAPAEGFVDPAAVQTNEPLYHVQTPPFSFGGQDQPSEAMDFTFDTITTAGSDDMLAAMRAIQNPTWWHTMMMPG
jgi:hypothetical protein